MTAPDSPNPASPGTPILVGAACGEYMDRVVVIEWRVAPGDAVEHGQVVAVVETAKAATEVEAPCDGVMGDILAPVGEEVAVSQPIGLIAGGADTPAPAPEPNTPADPAPREADDDARPGHDTVVCANDEDRIIASPAARRRAAAVGLDLEHIVGTGPGGRIKLRDVSAAVHALSTSWLDPEQTESIHFPDSAVPLRVTRTGAETGTPVLMLHGFAGDSSVWHPIERGLAAHHPVIRLDLPCHGRSPCDRFASFHDFVRPVLEAFDALSEGPVHVIGHSLGGAIALVLADQRPGMVRSLGLLAPTGLGVEVDSHILDGLCRASGPDSLAPWLLRLVVDPSHITDGYIRAAMATRAAPHLRACQAALAARLFPDGTQAFTVTPLLRRVAVPTRLIWGRADEVLPWQQALGAPGHVALHLLPAVGHLSYLEASDIVADVLRDLIATAEDSPGPKDTTLLTQEAHVA